LCSLDALVVIIITIIITIIVVETAHQHIAKLVSTCFFHLRRLRKLRRVLDFREPKCAFILTRMDYCNAVLANLPDSALAPLQRVLHAAASFVAAIGPRDHITPTLISLH